MLTCALCASPQTALIEVVRTADIVGLWAPRLQSAVHSCFGGRDELNYLKCMSCGLCFFDPMTPGNAAFYAQVGEEAEYYLEQKWEFEKAVEWLNGCTELLDVGAGEGKFAALWGRRYVGLEPSRAAAARARERGIAVIEATLESWLREGQPRVEAVTMFQVLEHVPDPRALLESACEALRDGGRLVVAVPTMDYFVGKATNLMTNLPPHHLTHWRQEVLSGMQRILPLDLVETAYTPVERVHRDFAVYTEISAALRRCFGLKRRLVDRRYPWRAISKLASVSASALRKRQRVGVDFSKGHTLMAMFLKR